MADLAAANITVTLLNQRRVNGRTQNNVKLEFGNGALTYPAGGVPVSKGSFGCPNVIESLVVYDKGTSGYEWKYDAANEKLVAIQSPSHVHSFLVKGGQAAAGTDALSIKGSAPVTVGKEAVTDATNLGGAGGGVQASTAAAGSQPSAVAIAAQVLRCEVVGW